MILYTEKQLQEVYNIDRKERMRLNIPTTTIEQYRPIYEQIIMAVFEDSFDTTFIPDYDDDKT